MALGTAAAITVVVGLMFVTSLKPAAAREIQAACPGLRPAAENAAYGHIPATAINFSAQAHDGHMVKLSDFRGRVVLVNFWASWCDVCASEKPSLEVLDDKLSGPDFKILALASDDNWENVKKRLPQGSPLTVLLDPPVKGQNLGRIAKSYGITAVPESFIVDRDGTIRYYLINKRDWTSGVAETCIRSLLDS